MPILLIIIIIVSSLLVGSGIGWTVKDWQTGAKMKVLESRDAVVTAANQQCAADVVAVQTGVKDVTDALDAKQRAAEAAMKDAQYWASKHSRLAEEVNTYQARPGETQCETIEREQAEYVQSRRTDS